MLGALMLLLAFLDRSVQHLAAVIAGLGFGTFIDEIGKFVTADNDDFYRPAVALIFGLFVIAFLVARTLVGQRRLSENEALANVLDLLAGTHDGPIEPDDRARIQRLLDLADPKALRTRLVEHYLAELPRAAEHESIIVGVVAYAAVAVVGVALIATSTPAGGVAETSTVATIAQVSSTVVGAALVGRGVVSLRGSRTAAYHRFMRGLLVWILLTQMFVSCSSQLAGLGGLTVNLVAHGSLRFALIREIGAG